MSYIMDLLYVIFKLSKIIKSKSNERVSEDRQNSY